MLKIVQKLESCPESKFCSRILTLDPSIRFAGILCKCGRLKAYCRKQGMVPHLNVPETKLLHREALLKAKMNRIFDKRLGKTNWSIESRDHVKWINVYHVKWINVYHEKDVILISTEITSNHDEIVQKIISLL
ncbi:MAG: hypothetical protein OEY17_08185 [Nitrosopumilus sp.]|nr:hypothetical protein [Nitrosopumilus sp.]MDH5659303.1 hypothetical protein [Nitrosopumilus sp.]